MKCSECLECFGRITVGSFDVRAYEERVDVARRCTYETEISVF